MVDQTRPWGAVTWPASGVWGLSAHAAQTPTSLLFFPTLFDLPMLDF